MSIRLALRKTTIAMADGRTRLTRLTDAHSKKWENHEAAVALFIAYYNFCRVHQTLRVTPAMGAGIADHIWTLKEMLSA